MKVLHASYTPVFPIYAIALILPLILIPLESVLHYPAIIEELGKAFIVFLILMYTQRSDQINTALLAVFLFALSENIFYLSNFVTSQTVDHFWMRFVLTSSIHLMNPVLLVPFGQKNKWLIIPMTIVAIVVHSVYNEHVGHFCNTNAGLLP